MYPEMHARTSHWSMKPQHQEHVAPPEVNNPDHIKHLTICEKLDVDTVLAEGNEAQVPSIILLTLRDISNAYNIKCQLLPIAWSKRIHTCTTTHISLKNTSAPPAAARAYLGKNEYQAYSFNNSHYILPASLLGGPPIDFIEVLEGFR